MSSHRLDVAVERLETAHATRTPCPPVRDVLPADDIAVAYTVQSQLAAHRTAAGASIVGRKIGLTNPRVQVQLGVNQPDFGVLFDDMRCGQNEPVDVGRLLQPKIEAEIAFVLKQDLDRDGITQQQVVDATDYVVAALEIVDSRIADWDIGIVDTIADNGSSGLFVLGDVRVSPAELDLAAASMTLMRDGEIVSSGQGSDCLGNPAAAVAWLANTAREHDSPLRRGDVVLSGALGPMVTVEPGDSYIAAITGIGWVRTAFTQRAAVQAS